MQVYQRIARIVHASDGAIIGKEVEWIDKYNESLVTMMRDAPLGKNSNDRTKVIGVNEEGALLLSLTFHHISISGKEQGSSIYSIEIEPDLGLGFRIKVEGKDKFNAKDEIKESFEYWLNERDNEW